MSRCTLLVASLLCATLVGCTPTVQGAWREEVELGDGRIILIQRTITWQEVQAWGQTKMYGVRETTVTIPRDSRQAASPPWRGRQESALLLDFDVERQEYVLVTLPDTCVRYGEAGRPRPPYLEYALHNGEWTMIALDTKLIGRRANLIVYPRVAREPPLITASEKAERQTSPQLNIVATGGLAGC